eukprot:350299-Chlamydomonas_euryale.AAC.2
MLFLHSGRPAIAEHAMVVDGSALTHPRGALAEGFHPGPQPPPAEGIRPSQPMHAPPEWRRGAEWGGGVTASANPRSRGGGVRLLDQ